MAVATMLFCPAQAAAAMGGEAEAIKPVGLILNGLAQERTGMAGVVGGELLILRDDLVAIGLQVPAGARIGVGGNEMVRIAALRGITATLDADEGTVDLRAAPDAFVPTRRRFGRGEEPTLSPVVPMAFLGYDLSLARSMGRLQASGFVDAGASGAWGVAATTGLLQPSAGRVVRLESSFQRDWPGRRLRLVVGDTVSRGGDLGSAVRFGGVRFGTDFSLAPDAINTPVPLLSGTALTPSTVELLAVSGRQSLDVGPGRFLIDGPPAINGAGEVVMTIRDATGSVQRVRQTFYSSNRLLRPGLNDFSFEAGWLRKRYGERSGAYGAPFAAASWRRGIWSTLTAGGRVEASRESAIGGLTLTSTTADWFELGFTAALSRGPRGDGSSWRAQVQRLGRGASFTASYGRSSAAFRQLGEERGEPSAKSRHELAASAGASVAGGDVTMGVVDARLRDGSRYRLGSIGYSASFRSINLVASVTTTRFAEGSSKGFLLSLSRPLGRRGSSAISAERGLLTATLQQSAPFAGGWSYGLASSRSDRGNHINGYALKSNSFGDIELTASHAEGSLEARATTRGALVLVGNRLVPTPRLQDGFAVVDVAGERGVALLQEGRPVARRAGAGRAVVLTGLQPYSPNRIAISFDDLPSDVDIDDEEQVAVPGYRQAAAIRFGKSTPGAPLTVQLVGDDGLPIAVGRPVSVGGRRIGVTGHDGLVFLKGARGGTVLMVGDEGAQCTVSLPTAPAALEGGIAGPLNCRPTLARNAAQ